MNYSLPREPQGQELEEMTRPFAMWKATSVHNKRP